MKLTTTKDRELQHLRALVHGDSGIGKTTSLGTLPEDGTIIACAERGLIPLRSKSYTVIQLANWQDVRELVGAFLDPKSIEDEATREAISSARVLAVDSLSKIGTFCKTEIIRKDRKVLLKERTSGRKDKPENVYDDCLTMEDWQLYSIRMAGLLDAICKIPAHLICTSLAAWTKDKRKGGLFRTPSFNGKLAHECPAYFDLVFSMEELQVEGKSERVWRTRHSDDTQAKDATGVLEEFEETNWTTLLRKVLTTKGVTN